MQIIKFIITTIVVRTQQDNHPDSPVVSPQDSPQDNQLLNLPGNLHNQVVSHRGNLRASPPVNQVDFLQDNLPLNRVGSPLVSPLVILFGDPQQDPPVVPLVQQDSQQGNQQNNQYLDLHHSPRCNQTFALQQLRRVSLSVDLRYNPLPSRHLLRLCNHLSNLQINLPVSLPDSP